MSDPSPTIMNVPKIALAIPPPETPTGVGRLVKKLRLSTGAPLMTTSPMMSASGVTARTTAR